MKFPTLLALAGSGLLASSSPTLLSDECSDLSPRPVVNLAPYNPRLPIPDPPERTKVCYVKGFNDGVTDDSCRIMAALHKCNNGGRVVFKSDTKYLIGSAMDLTFLRHIDIDIQGTVTFTSDTDYWQKHGFKFGFQNVTTYFKLGGEDVLMYGGGTFDGNGQIWYDAYAADEYILRPVLFGIDGLKDSIFANLKLHHSPQYYHFIANSSNIIFDNIDISGRSSSKNEAKNTDGWDTYRSSDITIMNSVVDNGDDCVSFKPNSTDVLIQNLDCSGSHGVSIGSLGQYPGVYDVVENIFVSNITLRGGGIGARIKVWPDMIAGDGDLMGGGGSGHVRNCTWEDLKLERVEHAIEINQCYGQHDMDICLQHPAKLTIDDIVFRRFSGTTDDLYNPQIAALACSSADSCSNITATDINVTSPAGKDETFCLNLDRSKLDVTCNDDFKGFSYSA